MIPAKAGPQIAIEAIGKRKSIPRFRTASKEKPNPKVIPNVIRKKATI
jgi:hypothetical protein